MLDALVESAARLCGADDVSIFRLVGDSLPNVAHYGPIVVAAVTPAVRGTVNGRCVLERRTIHVADLQAETEAFPEGSTSARELGFQTILAVPLLRESTPFGALVLRRTKVELFSDKQIELVETFADQAVIAIENVRLFEAEQQRSRELSESLQQQTATSEVLRVISSSPGELEPRPCWRTPRGFARPVTAPCGLAKEMASVSLLSMAHCLRPSWSNCGTEPCSIPARTSH